MENQGICPVCKKEWSRDCGYCQTRKVIRRSPLKLLTKMPWATHSPVWTDASESAMICERCGISIPPTMTMKELYGPCSARAEATS